MGGSAWRVQPGVIRRRKAPPAFLALAGAERPEKVATRGFVQARQVNGAVALVAQHLDQGRPSFFRRGLELAVGDAQQMHLQSLNQKIFSVSAVRARKRQ
jgi:hypothetical protein